MLLAGCGKGNKLFKGTVMQIQKICQFILLHIKYNTFHSRGCPQSKYAKCVFKNIQSMLETQSMFKVANFLRKMQTSRVNNSRILRVKNANFQGYYFYMNTNI